MSKSPLHAILGVQDYQLEAVLKKNRKRLIGGHRKTTCRAEFEMILKHEVCMPVEVLGVRMFRTVPFMVCMGCEAAYLPRGVSSTIDRYFVEKLVTSTGYLKPEQLRFLRITAGLKQKDISSFLGVVHEAYVRAEAADGVAGADPDWQLRLKLFYAQKIGLDDTEAFYNINKNLAKDCHSANMIEIPTNVQYDILEPWVDSYVGNWPEPDPD